MARSTAGSSQVLLVAALAGAGCACGAPGAGAPARTPDPEPGKISLETFSSASAVLPPSALAIAWVDLDAMRGGPLAPLLGDSSAIQRMTGDAGSAELGDSLDSIHRIAGGLYVTASGVGLALVVESDLEAAALFEKVRERAEARGSHAYPLKVRGRQALRLDGRVLVDAGAGLFLSGPEGLAGRTLDLADGKVTGSALDDELKYLSRETVEPGSVAVLGGFAPPGAAQWLEDRHLPSVVGARGLMAVAQPDEVSLRLGLLAGKPVKPIWFAQEVTTFIDRAALDKGVKDMGLAEWIETLEVELLSRGILVHGTMEGTVLVEAVRSVGKKL